MFFRRALHKCLLPLKASLLRACLHRGFCSTEANGGPHLPSTEGGSVPASTEEPVSATPLICSFPTKPLQKRPASPLRLRPHAYESRRYWDNRYKAGASQDWYATYADLQDYLGPLLGQTSQQPQGSCSAAHSSILVLGCGNSALGADLYSAGHRQVTNVDYSPEVIAQMRVQYGEAMPEMRWLVRDCTRRMGLRAASFSLAIDKGCMDAMLSGKGGPRKAYRMNRWVCALLRPGGHLIVVSCHPEAVVLAHLRRKGLRWAVELKGQVTGSVSGCFVYVARKS
eukprot:RCo005105